MLGGASRFELIRWARKAQEAGLVRFSESADSLTLELIIPSPPGDGVQFDSVAAQPAPQDGHGLGTGTGTEPVQEPVPVPVPAPASTAENQHPEPAPIARLLPLVVGESSPSSPESGASVVPTSAAGSGSGTGAGSGSGTGAGTGSNKIGEQKSEIRNQKSEIGNRKSEIRQAAPKVPTGYTLRDRDALRQPVWTNAKLIDTDPIQLAEILSPDPQYTKNILTLILISRTASESKPGMLRHMLCQGSYALDDDDYAEAAQLYENHLAKRQA